MLHVAISMPEKATFCDHSTVHTYSDQYLMSSYYTMQLLIVAIFTELISLSTNYAKLANFVHTHNRTDTSVQHPWAPNSIMVSSIFICIRTYT